MTTITVYWYDCDCAWITKYCDENHRKSADVSVAGFTRLLGGEG